MPRNTAKKKPTARKNAVPTKRVIAFTGVNSFLGANIVKRLQAQGKYQIIALDIVRPNYLESQSKFYKIDLTHPTADSQIVDVLVENKVDTFVHLAFLGEPIYSTSDSHELEVIGTLHVLNACAEAKVRKIVVKSTTMVYGANPRNPNYLSEKHPLLGNLSYPFIRDRVEVEQHIRKFRAKHPKMIITVLRLAQMLGPTVRNNLTKMLRRPFVVSLLGYDPLVQFLHEEDAISAFMISINENHDGEFNIIGRGVLPLATVMKLAGKIRLPIIYTVSKPLLNLLFSVRMTTVPGDHLDFIRFMWVADGDKAKKEMKFMPRYSTKETLELFMGIQRLRNIRLA
jgi:UDP-glucose 4-epimerase